MFVDALRERMLNIATEALKALVSVSEQYGSHADAVAALKALAELDKMRRPNPGEQK